MTDTEGTEARRSDGEETQFIQPIRDYGRAETKPLDLPRATIGGYRCFASMFVRQVRQCFSAVWADGFPRCRHRFPVM